MEHTDELPVGARIGKYRVTGRLGKGGMGVVYAGEDARLKRAVAIKVLSQDVADETDLLKRFLLEARAAASLNHPHVVTVHDIGQHEGAYFIVMELVAGGSAGARLAEHGAMPWGEATRIVADVCRGLKAAHAAGLIHRDVKPANILLTADGSAKLADFGLTKAPSLVSGGLTRPGTMIGTPNYMSPEHCSGETLDERADLYALGAVYYALLVGKPPYDGPDPALTLFAHCSAPIPDPRSVRADVPAGCAHVIARAMAKSRADRFKNAEEMLQAVLGVTANAVPVSGVSAATTELPKVFDSPPAGPPSKRRRRMAMFAAGVLCLSMVIAAIVAFGSRRPATGGTTPIANVSITLKPRPSVLTGQKSEVKAISIGGPNLVSVSADGKLLSWSLETGKVLRGMHHPAELDAVAITPDGAVAFCGGRLKALYPWDANTGDGLGAIGGFGEIASLAMSPSGKQLAVACDTELMLCDIEPRARVVRRLPLLRNQYIVAAVAFSRDGRRLAAVTGEGLVHVWDLPQPAGKHYTSPETFKGRLTSVAVSDDGGIVAFGSHEGVLRFWSPERDKAPTTWKAREMCIASMAFVPGTNRLAFAGEWSGPIRIADLAQQTSVRVPSDVQGTVTGLAFSGDGKTLAASGSDGTVRLWDVTITPRE